MIVIDLIEHIAEPDETGLLKIKPFTEINYEQIKSVIVYKSESVNLNMHREITFDDDVWRAPNRSVNFSALKGALRYEVKSAFLLANYTGIFEGGSGLKFATICQQIAPLIKFGELLDDYGVDSIYKFNSLQSLVKRNYFIKFINDVLYIDDEDTSFNLRFFEAHLNYGLFTEATLSIINEELNKCNITDGKQKRLRSYPIVPSDLLKKIIQESESRLNQTKKIIDEWETANNSYINAIRTATDTGIVYGNVSSIVNKRSSITHLVEPLRNGYKSLDNLKIHVLFYVLVYTGMRKEEALSCVIGCSNKHDEKYYIEAVLTKTDETQIKMKWIANKDTYDAIELYERYVRGMHRRAVAILENPDIQITKSLEHQLKRGLSDSLLFGVVDNLTSIKFTDANLGTQTLAQAEKHDGKESKFSLHKFMYALTARDIDQLESLGCNYKAVRGFNQGMKYVEGEIFHITPHMLRHNFAWFIIANRLGELDDIKHQFKHLASSMTMVYAMRGYESSDEMIGLFESFEELLVDNIAQNIAMEAAEGTLTGEAGKRLNNGAKSLVFNVTASSGSDTGRTVKQIHFKSLEAYKVFLSQNLKNIRGLPHGYCTAGPACKLKNVGLPSGCVYCPSYLVTEKQRVHWQAMKNFADEKLAIYHKLTPDKQSEYSLMAESWRDTSNAASIILTDRSPLKIDEVVA